MIQDTSSDRDPHGGRANFHVGFCQRANSSPYQAWLIRIAAGLAFMMRGRPFREAAAG